MLLFRKEIEAALATCPAFQVTYCVESGLVQIPDNFSGRLQTRQGILSPALAANDGLIKLATVFYLSGPPAMLKGLSKSLGDAGVAAEQIRIDAWE